MIVDKPQIPINIPFYGRMYETGLYGSKQKGFRMHLHATHYEIYVLKYLLVWKKTWAKSGNIRNILFKVQSQILLVNF